MESNFHQPTQEKIEAALKKAQQEYQSYLDKLSPEEREQAELKFKQMSEEENARMQELVEHNKKVLEEISSKEAPKFCPNCGSPADGGRFCAFCGSEIK